jgi:hypothetical protein
VEEGNNVMTVEQPIQVVDLGTKLGNSIVEFRRKAQQFWPQFVDPGPGGCLGIDKEEKYRADLEGQGCQFKALDLTQKGVLENLPEADYYVAWDFLEHLPDVAWSSAVIKVMLHKARRGVWLRMPSFEDDETTGEGALRKLGLRFTWTHWRNHTSHYELLDCIAAINEYKQTSGRGSIAVKTKAGRRIRSTTDDKVVRIDSPINTPKYKLDLGHKKVESFNPPLVAQWEIIVTM